MTAIGPYSVATVPLYSPTRNICLGKVVDCDSLLSVLSKYVPNYYSCVARANMERVYSDPANKYTVFAFDRLTCTSREQAISYCKDTTYEGKISPLAMTSSRTFMLPTIGTNSLLVESPDGQSIYINRKPVSMSIACGNGIVYMIM